MSFLKDKAVTPPYIRGQARAPCLGMIGLQDMLGYPGGWTVHRAIAGSWRGCHRSNRKQELIS